MFKTTVKKIADLTWEDFCKLFAWPCRSTIQADNPHVLIAKAADGDGKVVAYVTAEPILLVKDFILNPTANENDSQKAGDAIDAALAERAKVSRIWVVIPNDAPHMDGETTLRVYERKIYQPVTTTQKVGCDLESRFATFN